MTSGNGRGRGRGLQPASPSSLGDAPDSVRATTLDNGVQVLTERVPGVRSASVGVWVRHGSAHEPVGRLGSSHLLEHMVFKGTSRRTSREIALSLEVLGGSLDAYTSRENTSYQARVLDAHLPEALDVLGDLVTAPRLDPDDLTMEREVVLEEIAQVEDTPDDLVFELHGQTLWGDHPYGRSILGTAASVSAMGTEELRDAHAGGYGGRSLVVAAAGNVDHDIVVREAEAGLGAVEPGGGPGSTADVRGTPDASSVDMERPGAQTHVVFGTRVPGHSDPARHPLIILSTALGGGMSSRLFQRVREELGLCYSVFTYASFYQAAGVLGVYVGTRPATVEAAVEAIREELLKVSRDGLPQDELEATKTQMKGQIMLSLESTGSRMYRLAASVLHEERWLGLEGLLERVDGVRIEDVAAAASRWLDPAAHTVLALGPGHPSNLDADAAHG